MSSRNVSQITKTNYTSVSPFFHVSNIYESVLHDNMNENFRTFGVNLERTLMLNTASYKC